MSRRKHAKSDLSKDQRRQSRDVAYSRALVVVSLVLLVLVLIGDALYVAFIPRRHGHLVLPALFFAAPLVMVFMVSVAVWNWWVTRRRYLSARATHDADVSSR